MNKGPIPYPQPTASVSVPPPIFPEVVYVRRSAHTVAAQPSRLSDAIAADNSQWVHVLPAGQVFGRDGRGPYELRDPEAVMAATQRYHGRTKMLVDYEHQSMNSAKNGKPAPAAGWIVGLQTKADGIWAKVEWTAAAASAIREKAYRYLSPVFRHSPTGEIGFIQNVALTNSPNLELTAIASVEFPMELEQEIAALAALLGLPEGAGISDIRDVVAQLLTAQHTAVPDPAAYVPIGIFEAAVKEANSLRQGMNETAAAHHVEGLVRTGQLAPAMREWAISLCTVNKPALDGFIQRAGPVFNHLAAHSVATACPPGKQTGHDLSPSELALARNMGITPEEFMSARERD